MFRTRTLLIAGAAAVAAVAAASRVHRFEVVGASMRPALVEGDRLVVLSTGRVRPGEVVVVPDPRVPARLVVKRVVDRLGDDLLVRGDNPEASTDSRVFGPVAPGAVRGRAVYRYHPAPRRGRIERLVP